MRRLPLAAVAAALALLGADAAMAKASAIVTLNGIPQISLGPDVGGASWAEAVGTATLAPGQSWSISVPYTVTLSSNGLPASRDWQLCTPSFPSYCGAQPTGFESAEAYLFWDMDSRSGRFDDLNVTATDDVDFYLLNGVAHYSGTMTFSATNVGFGFRPVDAVLVASGFVDANPIPEPAPWALMAAALALGAGCRGVRRT